MSKLPHLYSVIQQHVLKVGDSLVGNNGKDLGGKKAYDYSSFVKMQHQVLLCLLLNSESKQLKD